MKISRHLLWLTIFGVFFLASTAQIVLAAAVSVEKFSTDLFKGDCIVSGTVVLEKAAGSVRVFFAANEDLSDRVYWAVKADGLELYRVRNGRKELLKKQEFTVGAGPWKISG